MENNRTRITFKAKVNPIEALSPEFTLCEVYVQGIGKNRNKSYMSKESVSERLHLLDYCPVVGHLFKYTDKDGNEKTAMGGHDIAFDENWNVVELTVPYGVVVNDSYDFITINEYGTDVEYLTAKAVLWTSRYPELKEAVYSEDFWFNESMEINILQHRLLAEDSNYTEILDWTYSALCLLGKADDKDSPAHTEPCFINSKVFPAEFSKNDFTEAMNEMKEKLSLCFSNNGMTFENKQGGETLEEKLVILEKFNKTLEDLDFSIDELSVEELESKMTELFGESDPVTEPTPESPVDPEPAPVESEATEPTPEPVAEPEQEPAPAEPATFSATYKEKREAAKEALPNNVVIDSEGRCIEEVYFYIDDMSDEYIFVERDHWTLNDFDCKHGRFAYVYDEETMSVTITGEFEEMVKVWLTLDEKAQLDAERANYELIKTEYAEYKASHSHENEKVDELVAYRANVEAGKVFEKFEKQIGETVEFKELKENVMNYSLAELEKECVYIVGLHATEINFAKAESTKETKTLKFSIEPEVADAPVDSDPYGDIRRKYLGR